MRETKKILSPLTGILSIFATSSVLAICSVPTGWYAEGNVGGTSFYGQTYPAGISSKTSGKAWNVDGGYKFTPYVALEAGYTRYAPTRITDSALGTGTLAQIQHTTIDVATKFMYPLQTTGIEPFIKLGIGDIRSQANHVQRVIQNQINTSTQTSNGLYLAAGVAYYFTPNFAGNLQYARGRGNNNTGTPSAYTAGFTFLLG